MAKVRVLCCPHPNPCARAPCARARVVRPGTPGSPVLPGHRLTPLTGTDFSFNTTDPDWLKANFDPLIFDLLPWALLTAKSGVDQPLADQIARARSFGTALTEVASHRNEAVANRCAHSGRHLRRPA